jgi:hypothetical protein
MTATLRLAPCQLISMAFDNLRFEGRVRDALGRLEECGAVRIIDAALLSRTIDDDIVAIEFTGLPQGRPPRNGALVRRLLGVSPVERVPTDEAALGKAMLVDSEYEYGMTAEELDTVLEDVPRRGGMAAILVEHSWALPLKQAVHDAGGYVLAQDFLSPETLVALSDQLLRE